LRFRQDARAFGENRRILPVLRARISVGENQRLVCGGSWPVATVLVRDWPGHKNDDVLVTTDLTLSAKAVIENYCLRWSIEETFGWAKSRLGLEDPHNRSERAVQHTAPMALSSYSFTVLWYVKWSKGRKLLPLRRAPWYKNKTTPSFSDMLATLRRQCWSVWISDQAKKERFDQKSLAPLIEIAGYG
jgi:hypothetical protein